jgi:hypothetical protein
MNKEQQELLDEAYETYTNYPLATIQDHHTNILYQNLYKGWCIRIGRSIVSPHPTRHLTKEEFINKCKTDSEFSERWGLKIEERELSLDEKEWVLEKTNCINDIENDRIIYGHEWEKYIERQYDGIQSNQGIKIPTKLIAVTHNNKTIESYE